MTDKDRCPLILCNKLIGDGHWVARPDNSAHTYHTDKEGIARHWEHIDGLDVTPSTDPFPKGTTGYSRSVGTGSDSE